MIVRALKYPLPDFLCGRVDRADYVKWLGRISIAHVKRDRKRGNSRATREQYMKAVHAAVVRSAGCDTYTGEKLDWSLLGKYDNARSATERRNYKAALALKPTVDHVGDGCGAADFRICSWRTNQAKGDLELQEFITVCRLVVAHAAAPKVLEPVP